MNGRQLADEARKRRPDLRVLFTTAYARNAIVHDGRLDPGVELITKPYTQAALAAKLRDIMDARHAPGRILLVEDEAAHTDAGYGVSGGGRLSAWMPQVRPSEAMNKLALVPGGVDAVILDIGLPDRSGEALCREIRAIHPSLPIVLATGHGATTLREVFKGETAIGFVQKPYAAQDLLRRIAGVGHFYAAEKRALKPARNERAWARAFV